MTQRHPAQLNQLLNALRRQLGLIVAIAALVLVAALAFSFAQDDRFRASSEVLINRQSVASQLANASDSGQQPQTFQQVLMTQAKLARTPTVLRDMLRRAGLDAGDGRISADDARDSTDASPNPDSDIITFSAVRPTVREAKQLAISYANAYVAYRRILDGAALTRALADVNQALRAAEAQGAQGEELAAGLARNRQQLQTRLALETQNAQIVAGPDEVPQVQPRTFRNAIVALILGLALGGAAAYLRVRLDVRIRSGAELEEALALPILSRVADPGSKAGDRPLVMRDNPGSASAESIRILRTNLSFGLLSSKATVVMVSSATQGEGKSTTITNLAIAEAMAGKRVVVVDLDLRRPRIASVLGLTRSAGLTSVALGQISLTEALEEIQVPGSSKVPFASNGSLHALASGPLPPDPAEFISTEAVRSVVDALRESYDLILLDAPPLVGVSDATVITTYADAVFLCTRIGVVTRPLLLELSRTLNRVEAPVLGLVITGAERDQEVSYAGYYGYGVAAP